MTNAALRRLSRRLDAMYAKRGRPRLRRRSSCVRCCCRCCPRAPASACWMGQPDCNLLFRWFAGPGVDDRCWPAGLQPEPGAAAAWRSGTGILRSGAAAEAAGRPSDECFTRGRAVGTAGQVGGGRPRNSHSGGPPPANEEGRGSGRAGVPRGPRPGRTSSGSRGVTMRGPAPVYSADWRAEEPAAGGRPTRSAASGPGSGSTLTARSGVTTRRCRAPKRKRCWRTRHAAS